MASLVIGGLACAGLALFVLISFSLAVEGHEDNSGFHERQPRRTLGQIWRSALENFLGRTFGIAPPLEPDRVRRVTLSRHSHEPKTRS